MANSSQNKQRVKQLTLTCANWIASKRGGVVTDVKYPDEVERNKKAVDLEFVVREQRFVLEHTELQPFDDFYELSEPLAAIFSPWARTVEIGLPKDAQCILEIPARKGWFASSAQRETALHTLAQWIVQQVPVLLARSIKPRHYVNSQRARDGAVPFDATLAVTRRLDNSRLDYWLRVSATRQLSGESDFKSRVERALKAKLPKLARAKKRGFLSVLLFETRAHVLEIGLNTVVPAQEFAIQYARELIHQLGAQPDVIVIANTNPIESYWLYWVIKSGDRWFDDLYPQERFGHWWPLPATEPVSNE